MGANDNHGGAIFDPRGMIGRIYVELHMTLLHTKYISFRSCGFMYFHYKLIMADNDFTGVWLVWTLGAWLAGCLKRSITHC